MPEKSKNKQKTVSKILSIILSAVMICSLTCFVSSCTQSNSSKTTVSTTTLPSVDNMENPTVPSTEELYSDAMTDSVFADTDEILPLVTIDKNSSMVTFDESGEKVLMLSWHRYPDSYIAGESFKCTYGEIWVFTDKEILSWYKENSDGIEDFELRLEQLIGLPEEKEYTHFSAFWVDVDELIRPAYQPDVTKQLTEADLDGSSLGEHKAWFDGNIIWSYFDSAYPWTRLGYTYDWSNGESEYGLTEFIILSDSEIEVEWTLTTEEFLAMLASGVTIKE